MCAGLLASLLVAANVQARPLLHVLFVGNSLTYYHNLPSMVEAWTEEFRPAAKIKVEMLAEGGALLRQHLRGEALGKLLKTRRFQVVVFQELGGFPLCPDDFPGCEDSPRALSEMVALIRGAGSRALWFATYASPDLQPKLSELVAHIATAGDIEVADTGAALARYAAANPEALLVDPADGMHPTPLGSWIMAASLAHALFPSRSFKSNARVSCAPEWPGGDLKLSSLASSQMLAATRCLGITRAEARRIDAATAPIPLYRR